MKIKVYGNKNSKQIKCKYCHSVIEYWHNEVQDEYIDYKNIDIHYKKGYIICPVCKNKIYIE